MTTLESLQGDELEAIAITADVGNTVTAAPSVARALPLGRPPSPASSDGAGTDRRAPRARRRSPAHE